jgi:hypothetical protein
VAVAANLLTDRYTIPDETLYMELGRAIVHGVSPDAWYPGYGQSLYDSIGAFGRPLVVLFQVFGPERLVGQFFSAVVGAAVAGMTVAIALRFLRPSFALVAGLVVALAPSQVLFSSVVLREAHVWLALTLVAVGAILMARTEWRALAAGVVAVVGGLLALGFLRDQTMLAAAWALALALAISPRRLWIPRMAAGLAVVLVVPLIGGAGLGGAKLIGNNAETLAKTRAKLAVGATSAFGGATPPPSAGGTPGNAAPPAQAAPPGAPVPAAPTGTVSDTARAASNRDDGIRTGVAHLPAGLVDVTLRPFPWQSTVGLSLLLARVETIAWYLLYALTAVGIVVSLRRRPARLALQFPVLVMGMLVGIAALTQGNLGTAFRHRDQILWVLALCSAAALQWLLRESRWARRRGGDPDLVAAPAKEAPAPAVAPQLVLPAPARR